MKNAKRLKKILWVTLSLLTVSCATTFPCQIYRPETKYVELEDVIVEGTINQQEDKQASIEGKSILITEGYWADFLIWVRDVQACEHIETTNY